MENRTNFKPSTEYDELCSVTLTNRSTEGSSTHNCKHGRAKQEWCCWYSWVELWNRGMVTFIFSFSFSAFLNTRQPVIIHTALDAIVWLHSCSQKLVPRTSFPMKSCRLWKTSYDWSIMSHCQVRARIDDSIIVQSDTVTILIDKNIMKSESLHYIAWVSRETIHIFG